MSIFSIADVEIDMSRSVVIKGEQQTHIEPKVLKVLFVLAKQQNQVVTHQELMESVWQGTEVVPNALQRCIAILRKVLEDDAKNPRIIATHPRIGYRLITQVNWHTQPKKADAEEPDLNAQRIPKKLSKKHYAVGLLIIVALLSLFYYSSKAPVTHNGIAAKYTGLRQVTKTDAHETQAILSPDSQYIVLNRYAGSCKSHLWAKHIETNREIQLTANAGSFDGISFTLDGRELVFSQKSHCNTANYSRDTAENRSSCWHIATIDFSLALTTPQTARLRHQCQADKLTNPKALTNHQYVYLQHQDGQNSIVLYDDLSKKNSVFYSAPEQYIYDFDYSAEQETFAILSKDRQLNNVLVILNKHGTITSQNIIEPIEGLNSNAHFIARFEPQGKFLLALNNKALYQISLAGEITSIQTPLHNFVSVTKQPNSTRLLAVNGSKDIDIVNIDITKQKQKQNEIDLNQRRTAFNSFARTKAQERHAKFQPNGDKIAFISNRNGIDQLWLWHNGQATQLSHNASKATINQFSWSPSGQQLAWVSGDSLKITDLHGKTTSVSTAKPLSSVTSWYKETQLLVLVNDPHPNALYQLDIQLNTLTPLNIHHVESAWLVNNMLFYSVPEGQVFKRALNKASITNTKPLPLINGKAFFIKDNFIYSADLKTRMLNQYDSNGQFIKAITRLEPTAWKVTDLNESELLLEQFVAINQEVIFLDE